MERNFSGLFNRRVGPLGALVIVAVGIALTVAVAQLLPERDEPETAATPTPTATPCKALDPPYGKPPQDLTYDPVDAATRAQTVEALHPEEGGGKVDVREVRQGGVVVGRIVGVTSRDPTKYAARLIASADGELERGTGYAILPLESGARVAIGVKGCRTVLVNARDTDGTRLLAAAIFG
ncbi:hypothetical protein DVA67_006150 [Solirubrobacter sp. CPCC 204708]|uniref:Uncharacterized protein n=1 Tax=Solirubrobacter deserti TaxID=2282478 RepID=A0ABT4RCB9_9ACTN|nr:hypothetical protein [Solirubrobacter deserti]MBE2315549.1 hypothetical protein [Solirubrobacter deserti]MDA0136187.1 hypothetical protein [Solirubrobacter deserti]